MTTPEEVLLSRLQGALNALRGIKECVPPKDWCRYAEMVLALEEAQPARTLVSPFKEKP